MRRPVLTQRRGDAKAFPLGEIVEKTALLSGGGCEMFAAQQP
jgi:hypothetical protein